MANLWPDSKSEKESQKLRDLATRVLVETDPKKLDKLIVQMTRIVEAQLRTRPPN